MREVITICIGGAGVRIGERFWELLCREHGIRLDGERVPGFEAEPGDATGVFFQEIGGRYIPRTVFVDLDPTPITQMRESRHNSLFIPRQLISGKESAAGIFAHAYHSSKVMGVLDEIMDQLARAVDACSSLQGFLIIHSLGGGTGSGFTALLMERLSAKYSKEVKLQFAIAPSAQTCTSVTETYNTVLSTHFATDHSNCCFIIENGSIYDIARKDLDVERPTYKELNDVIAHAIADVTASLRFSGEMNGDLNDFPTNLVPYPRIRFPLLSYAPLVSPYKPADVTVRELTRAVFEPNNQFVQCAPNTGKYMSCCVLYRGDVSQGEVNQALQVVQPEVPFVDWCPTGFKVGINKQRIVDFEDDTMARPSRSLVMLSNTTAMANFWARLNHNFDLMYRKRAYVHWYTREGMEEGEFNLARENLAILERDYKEVGGGAPD